MVIALTVGLSLASRSIINLKNTTSEADSQKAFQAAEAGIEIGLQKPLGTTDVTIGQKTLDNNAIINNVLIHAITGSSLTLNNGDPVSQDQGIDIWLTNYPDYSGTPWTGKIYIYWGSTSGCKDAALEAIVISGISSTDPNATVNRYGVDPCGSNSVDKSQNRNGSNKLSAAQTGASINGKTYNFSTAVSITNGILMRIIPFYGATPLAVVGYDNSTPANLKAFPAQGRIITSTGSYGSTKRQVSFFQGYPLLPSEYFYTLFQPK